MNIHATAVINNGAQLEEDVQVGPYSVIGENVKIGKGVRIGSFCVIDGDTVIGDGCKIFTGAVVGSIPQDLKYSGASTSLVVGRNNIIREYVTINLSTDIERKTEVGNNNLIMAYSHIAHDCKVGNNCIIANCGTLAGHVVLEDGVVIGGLVAVHQFVRLGAMSIVGGCSKVVTDIPPYSTCDGHPAKFFGLNIVGLKRAGFSHEVVSDLKKAYGIYFSSGLNRKNALEEIKKQLPASDQVNHLIDFISNSKRGICH